MIGKCPYLGVLQDPGTSYAYPTSANKCFGVSPAGSIDLSFQGEVCLASCFDACPVYAGEGPGEALPEEIRAGTPQGTVNRKPLVWVSLCCAVLLSILGAGFLMNRSNDPGPSREGAIALLPSASPTPSPAPTLTEVPLLALPETPTPVAQTKLLPMIEARSVTTVSLASLTSPTPTVTATPTATVLAWPTAIPRPAKAEPTDSSIACTPPDDWVVYIIGPGESLSSIARDYDMPLITLLDANCLSSDSQVYVGQWIYLPYLEATPTPVPTYTPTPTNTRRPRPTDTPVPPDTDTPEPTATLVTPSPTWTANPPTETPTPVPPTNTPTDTPVPPTSTPVPPTPTSAPTIAPDTATPLPPSPTSASPTGTPVTPQPTTNSGIPAQSPTPVTPDNETSMPTDGAGATPAPDTATTPGG